MTGNSNLRYVDAGHIEAPLPEFGTVDVLDGGGRRIGSIDGVLVDPAERKARYLVIRRGGVPPCRELLPLTNICVDPNARALRVDDEAVTLEKFEPQRYPAFSDDDLLTAIFANRAA
jgi:hypothetical protein